MMQNEYKEILADVFCDVLLKYAFLFGDEFPSDKLPVNGAEYLKITLGFSGERSGSLGMLTTTDLGDVLVSNVLGEAANCEMLNEDMSDVLKELINVVCGQFLTLAFGEEPVIDLSPPALSKIGEEEWERMINSEETACFMIEDIPAILYVSVG